MSKIGRQIIILPDGVNIEIQGSRVHVSGPKGALERQFPGVVSIEESGNKVSVKSNVPALWGTWRSHVANMVTGVSKGFRKQLKIQGVGYRVLREGDTLTFALGFSHPIKVAIPQDLEVEVNESSVTVGGVDKEKVGQFASFLRSLRPPDRYKGKGIRYEGEVIKLKPGKKVGASAS